MHSPLRPCPQPGCPALVRDGRCPQHTRAQAHSRPLYAIHRLYRTARWRALRLQVLHAQPLCVDCLASGHTTPATDVDHEIPHRGDLARFWHHGNLRGRCHACHSRKTQRGA